MEKYEVAESLVRKALEKPGRVIEGHSGRMVAQKKLDSHVLRVVFKKDVNTFVVITVYKARSERYEI
jgi:hypothetical protein